MDDLGDLDFNINCQTTTTSSSNDPENGGVPDWSKTETAWTPLPSAAGSGNNDTGSTGFKTPQAESLSSEQFKHLNEEGLVDTLFSTALNPVACLFHVGFKGASIFSFMFLNAMLNEEILTFIIVVVLAAFDFWTVKNVTGRLLVNLRWDSHIDEWGNEVMIYESDDSRKDQQAAALAGDIEAQERLEQTHESRVGKTDSRVFWWGTYMTPLIWGFFFLMQFMKFSLFWMITAGVCFSLSFTNAQGFYYCQKSHTQKLTEYIQERGLTMFREATRSTIMPAFMANLTMPSIFGGRGATEKSSAF